MFGRGAAQNSGPQHRLLHGIKIIIFTIAFWQETHLSCPIPNFVTFLYFHLCLTFQERAFGELEKNSDKQLANDSQGQSDPPSHFHQLLSGLHKHLLAHCYIHSSSEVYSRVSNSTFATECCVFIVTLIFLLFRTTAMYCCFESIFPCCFPVPLKPSGEPPNC